MHSGNIISCSDLKHIESLHIDEHIQDIHDLHGRAQQCTNGNPVSHHFVSTLSKTVLSQSTYTWASGDSYSQTGFDINGNKPSASNPLGNPPLPGYTAAGGLNWVGMLVSQLQVSNLLSYNFAYGGATTDSNIVKPYDPSVKSFVDQVGQFSSSLAAHPSYAPWTASNTLVGVWIGVNDVGNTYYLSNVTDVTNAVISRYFEQLQIIYNAGARNFVLLSVPRESHTPPMLLPDLLHKPMLTVSSKQSNTRP